MEEYVGIAVCFLLAGAVTGAMLWLASRLGERKPSPVKSDPFECGKLPFALPRGRLVVQFFLTAILFILFDVELVFLYPWAVVSRSLGWLGLVEVGVFLGVLMVGYVYAWANGALEW